MAAVDHLLSHLLPALILIHLFAAPYTKVEESFSIQATHDILVYGTPTHDIAARFKALYDHFTFPGAVPRSFVGPVLLAGTSQPLINWFGFEHAQLLVRAVLGLFNAAALQLFSRNLAKGLGKDVSRWWTLLMAGQFHIIFYASRTLPNMFAFGMTTVASAFLIPYPDPKKRSSRQRIAVSILVFAAIIFRSEVALLLGTTGLTLLATGQTTLRNLAIPFAISIVAALILSVPLDSYFWQEPLWPELWGFYSNVVHGNASNWGTSPWHYYFTSAIPRLLLNPLSPIVLIPFACSHPATAGTARNLVVPNLLFVAIYSLQPHKEARFIFYVVPALTAAAAQGAHLIVSRRSKSPLYALSTLIIGLSIPASALAATAILLLSSLNYPGGDALNALYAIASNSSPPSPFPSSGAAAAAAAPPALVHTDVLSCMTGVTLFAQNPLGIPLNHDHLPTLAEAFFTQDQKQTPSEETARIRKDREEEEHQLQLQLRKPLLRFDKSEDEATLSDPFFWSRFDYLLLEDPSVVAGGAWETVAVVEGYAGLEILKPGDVGGKTEAMEQEDGDEDDLVVGKGRLVATLREHIRAVTGGWWVGPRMEPRIRIMKRDRSQKESLPLKAVVVDQ